MALYEICDEISHIVRGLDYGQISFEYDDLMCAMKPGHPAEILNEILSYIGWDVFAKKDVPLNMVEETFEDLKNFRSAFQVEELDKPIKELKQYIEDNKHEK